jgi:hypothetical protein
MDKNRPIESWKDYVNYKTRQLIIHPPPDSSAGFSLEPALGCDGSECEGNQSFWDDESAQSAAPLHYHLVLRQARRPVIRWAVFDSRMIVAPPRIDT